MKPIERVVQGDYEMTVHRTKGEDTQLKAVEKDSEPDDENSVTDDVLVVYCEA